MTAAVPQNRQRMSLGSAGLELIKSFEQFRPTAYMPTKNDVPTIGYGHTAGVKMGDVCTMLQALAWLREDVRDAEDAVRSSVKVSLTQNQFDALVSLAFNIGAGNFANSSLVARLNAGNFDAARDPRRGFPAWNKQKGRVLPGLVRRRQAELELFLKP